MEIHLEKEMEAIRDVVTNAHDAEGNPREGGKSPYRVYELTQENADINLADVILAIRDIEIPFHIATSDAWWNRREHQLLQSWNMRHDSLRWHEKNQPETVELIFKILCTKSR